jgi:CRP/FNR family cyclic AMP-dependent transcriptional regulator
VRWYVRQNGTVKLTVVPKLGKEATIGILSVGDFFGEGCLTGQFLRLTSATSVEDCSLARIENGALQEVQEQEQEQAFPDMFVAYLLTGNIRNEEGLIDQLFSSSEKGLARILLLLAKFGKEDAPETVIPKVSQETLAEMVGTTRSRLSLFMNKFRKLGFIKYDGGRLEFFGEGCLAKQLLRLMSATSIEDCSLTKIENGALQEVQHQEHAFSDMFVANLLNRIFGMRKA